MQFAAHYIPYSDRYGTEGDTYKIRKHWFNSYEDVREWIHKNVQSYYTPFRMELLEEEFDWDAANKKSGASIMVLTVWQGNESKNVIFANTNLYIMNNEGKTVDRLRI